MNKNVIVLICLAVLVMITTGCQKDIDSENPSPANNPDNLLPEEVDILDQIPGAGPLSLSDIVLPNGFNTNDYLQVTDSAFYAVWARSGQCATPQECKSILIGKMMAVALTLTDRSLYKYESEGQDKPAQDGLAYSYNSKDHTIRQTPPSGSCKEQVYGLDCSGFLYQVFKNAGVVLPTGTADTQRDTQVIRKSVLNAFPNWENQMQVKDLGQYPVDKLESGDIIYWKRAGGNAFHIGLIAKTKSGKLAVFQSNGSDGSGGAGDCAKNYGPHRGPRTLELNDPYWFGAGKSYSVVRIIVRDWDFFGSGGWTISLDKDPFVQDSKGIIWMATQNGLLRFDGQKYTLFNTENSGLPENAINQIEIGSDDYVWVGTKKGLTSFDGSNWKTYNRDNSNMPTNDVSAIRAFQGGLWVGLSGIFVSGLYKFESGHFTSVPDPPGMSSYYVDNILADENDIWIDGNSSLMHFNGNGWVRYPYSSIGLINDFVATTLHSDNSGGLWFGTFHNGLCHFKDGVLTSYNPSNSQVPGTSIFALLTDHAGEFWICFQKNEPNGTVVGGLAHQTNNNHWNIYNLWPFGGSFNILEDPEKNIWTAGPLGLSVLYR